MALPQDIDIRVTFELQNATPNFKLEDITDYATLGIALSDVIGFFTITDPGGTIIHQGSFAVPDIDADVSLENTSIALPLDANNKVAQGDYQIDYSIQVSGAVTPGDYVMDPAKNYDYCHVTPVVDLDVEIDCFCSKITSIDSTDYTGGPNSEITSQTRTHTVTPPVASGLSATIEAGATVVVTPIVSQTWTQQISTDMVWTYTDGLIVTDTITGSEEQVVKCDISLCDIQCCLEKLNNSYTQKLKTSPTEAMKILPILTRVAQLIALFRGAIECGRPKFANTYLDEILSISGCEPGCSCADADGNEPVQIVPICSTGTPNSVIVAAGTGIAVVANTVGDTTTYTVSIDSATAAKIAGSFNTFVEKGTGDGNVTESIDGEGNRTFTIDFPSAGNTVNMMSMEVTVTFVEKNVPQIQIGTPHIYGTGFQAPTSSGVIIDAATWLNYKPAIKLVGFRNTNTYHAYITETKVLTRRALTENTFPGLTTEETRVLREETIIIPDIIHKKQNELWVGFRKNNGDWINGERLSNNIASKIIFNILIIES